MLSNQLVIDRDRAEKLKKYVAEGGILIIDGRYGVVDNESLVNKDLPGGETNVLCGVDYIDTDYENLDFVFFLISAKASFICFKFSSKVERFLYYSK